MNSWSFDNLSYGVEVRRSGFYKRCTFRGRKGMFKYMQRTTIGDKGSLSSSTPYNSNGEE
jgi:hypothetical protein